MRRATGQNANGEGDNAFQSTLSMRRATHDGHGHDRIQRFQSTLSMRRATHEADDVTAEVMISIHALHEESDPRNPQPRNRLRISIHALHEESDQLADA